MLIGIFGCISQIKYIFGPSWAFLFSIAEGAAFVLDELELILIQEEKLTAFFAVLQQNFGGDVDEVADG